MRLLRAELRKLRRPLTGWVLGLGALLAVLLAWGGLANDQRYLAAPGYRHPSPVSCAAAGMSEGSDCTRRLAVYRQVATAVAGTQLEQARSEAVQAASVDAYVQEPIGSGAMAAGLMASLPGLALVAVLAAGHVGGEWNGRTLTTVMTAEGRRWRLLAAKVVSVWLAALATLAVMFATLAAASPVWRSVFPLPVHHPTATEQWSRSWPILAHGMVTLAVFTLLAVTPAVLTKSIVGTLTLTLGAVIVGLATAGFPTATDWTLGTWVASWTRFSTPGERRHQLLVTGRRFANQGRRRRPPAGLDYSTALPRRSQRRMLGRRGAAAAPNGHRLIDHGPRGHCDREGEEKTRSSWRATGGATPAGSPRRVTSFTLALMRVRAGQP